MRTATAAVRLLAVALALGAVQASFAQRARLSAAEQRFMAPPHRCALFLGTPGSSADNVDASYGGDLARALRSRPDAVDRIRAACEQRQDQAQARIELMHYRLAR